ncbi:Ig-like domain-containing protein [Terribacillus sp. DMT04]|uniref:Ig-like domain-containing protein n=1 Tax=Terribacillus sp. DMT04 TaxID=2850441 RepID=UPI001C2BAB2C|nr:Ig-like domain-containing protein [Terribacillus sp. DMT04]QXE01418.1 hypothetical protein KS242_15770 [Terribacillus sp. DMT04]
MGKQKNYDHKKNMQRKNKLRMAKRSSALLTAAAIVVTPYVYDSEQKVLSKYTAEAADIAVLGNQTLGATYQDGVLTLRLRGNQLANIGAISNYSPNFQLPEELSGLLQNPNIRSATTINYSIPYAGVGGIALNHTGTVQGSNITFNTATNSFGANVRHTLGLSVASPTTFTARINLRSLGITELPTAPDGRLDFRGVTTDSLIATVDLLNRRGAAASLATGISDTQPPEAPVLSAVDSDDTTLSGTAEANAQINITLPDGSTATATADANGNWSTAIPEQAPGGTISATATDAAGNQSPAGTTTVTNADTEAPAAPEIAPVDSDDTTLSGTAEAESTITITLADGTVIKAETDANGNWSAEIPAQEPDSEISVVATDAAGNQSNPGTAVVTDVGGGADTEPPAAPVIAPITNEDTTLTGTAEANADIVVTLPDGTTSETTANADGNWAVDIPAQEAGSDISAIAIDEAGNESDAGTVTVTNADTDAPAAPEITPIDNDDTTLSGTAEPNTTIFVTLPDGSEAEAAADADGNWTVDIPAQEAGSDISAIAVDEAGNESGAGTVTVTNADTDAPAAPEISPIDNDDTTLSGTAEPNATIIVTLPDGSEAEAAADADGNWTVDIPAQEAGSDISAIAVDEAGNESDAGTVTVTNADTDAPAAPEIDAIDSDDTSLSGTAEPNAAIDVTLPDGSVVETTADADGNWMVDIQAQDPGNIINVTATDDAGNESAASTATVTNADTEAPAAPEINPVDSNDNSLSGTAEPNTDIELTFSDGTKVETRTDADGNWDIEIPEQEPGSEISVVAIDNAGNQSDASVVVVNNYDSAPPAAPEINPINSDDTFISGTGEANATIIVTLPDGTTVEAIADSDGNWNAEIPAQEPGDEISAIAIDEAGNESESESVVVTNADVTAPAVPDINPIDSDDTSLSGSAEANSDIIVTLPDGTEVKTTADADGNWTAEIPVQDPGAVLTVAAVDEAGNQSDSGAIQVTNADTEAPNTPNIDPVDSDDTSLSGTAEANTDVIVTLPDGSAVRTTADANGNWSVDIPTQDPGSTLSVVAVDDAGNVSGNGTIAVTNADITAPAIPETNPVNSDDTSLSGTTEENADVIVTLPDGSAVRTTADADGNWTVDIPAQDPGSQISVVAVDEAGNVSEAGTIAVTNADITAPAIPEINPVDSDDLSLSGTTEANADVVVTLPDGSAVRTTADAEGNWTVDIPTQDPGSQISVVAVDEAGNTSEAGTIAVTNADITAPAIPEINPVDSDDLSLSGTTEANADVIVTLPDGSAVRTTADADGNWTVDIPAQVPGSTLSVVAVDNAGNVSGNGTIAVTNADTTAPIVPEINPVDSDDTSLSGTTEENADVIVTLPDGTAVQTTADAEGNWAVDIPTQDPGSQISVVAIDEAGNTSEAGTADVTNADVTAPVVPEINAVDSDDTSLSGTTEANADVIVTLPDGSAVRTTADADGNWAVDIPAQDPGSTLSVVAVDNAGNVSGNGTIAVTNADTTAPAIPEINPVDSDDLSLSGTTEANADVVVTLPDGSAVQTTVDTNGNWTVDIPAQDPGSQISVVAVDEAGNTSESGTIAVTNADVTAPIVPEINPVDSDDTSLSGTTEANADVIVTLPDGSAVRTTADADGNWTVDIPAQDPGSQISVVAVDVAGNTSNSETVTVTNADTEAPAVPEINSVDNDDTSLSGTTEANADIIVTLPNGSTVNTTADADGNWSITISAQEAGSVVSVVAIDEAGNVSGANTVEVTNSDTTAPEAPAVNPVSSDDTSLSGTAEPNADIVVTLPDGTIINTTAGVNGEWTASIPNLDADETISVVAVDDARNVSESVSITVMPGASEIPAPPVAAPISAGDNFIFGLSGFGSFITLYLADGTLIETRADDQGQWSAEIPPQEAGSEIQIVETDENGNSSEPTVITVGDDTEAPPAPIALPVSNTDTALSGIAEPESTIAVTLPDGSQLETTTDSNGNWSVSIPVQAAGDELTIVSSDAAGNQSEAQVITVTDGLAPESPAVDPVTDIDTSLSGSAEPDSTVVVTLPDGSTVETTVGADGNWETDIPAQNPNEEIIVIVTDPAGNTSDPVIVPVENSDTEAPATPSVDPVTDEDDTISGDAEPDSTVVVTLPGGNTVEAPVDEDGNWEVDIPTQEPGDDIIVVVTDPADNTSDPVVVPVEDANQDTEAPDTPSVDPVTDENETVSGDAEPDSTVVVTLPDGNTVETPVDEGGNWEVEIPAQEPGDDIIVVVTDPADNTSNPVVVPVEDANQDTEAPEVPSVDPVTDENETVSGDAEPDATVVVTLPDGTTVETPVDEDGNWEVDIPAQEPGDDIIVVVTDPADNTSAPVVVPVEDANQDTEAPVVPSVDPVTDENDTISGDAEPDSTVVVTLPDGNTVEAPVDEDGNWEVDIPTQEPGDDIIVVVTDPADNTSDPVVVPVEDANQDTEAPDTPSVDPVTDENETVSGDAEPDSTVVVTLPDGNTVEAPVDENGNWEVEIPAQEPGDDIIVVVTDPADNTSDPVVVPVEDANQDTEAPDTPSVNPVTDENETISGDAEPDSTVVVTLPDGNTVEAPVDEDGNWEVDIPAQEPGDDIIVVVTDPADNVSDPVVVPVEDANQDTEAPATPSVDPVTDENDTVSGDAEPDATVVVTLPDGTTVETPVDEDGNWEVDIPAQEPGDDIIVVVTDPADNTSDPVVVPVEDANQDTEAPEVPSVDPVTDEDDTVSGDAEPDSTVVVTLPDGTTVETPVDEDGNWEVDIPAQEPGEDIIVVVTDPADNTSDPVVVPVEDANQDTEAPDAPSVDPVTDNNETISGDAEPDSTVVVTLPDGTTVETPVDEDGNWEVEIPAQEPGDDIIVVVTDPADNTSDPVVVPVEEADTNAPDAPTVNPIDEEDTLISGDAEPDSTIVVTLPDGTTAETQVDKNGNWEIKIPSQESGEEITVVVTDSAGNVSDPVVVTVDENEADTSDPITVNPIDEDEEIISGGGVPGTEVVVVLPNGNTEETTVDENGNWSVPAPGLNSGEEVTVIGEDQDGNKTEPETVTVGSGNGSPINTDGSMQGNGDSSNLLPSGSSYNGNQLPQTSNNFFTSILLGTGALFAGAFSLLASRFRRKKQ